MPVSTPISVLPWASMAVITNYDLYWNGPRNYNEMNKYHYYWLIEQRGDRCSTKRTEPTTRASLAERDIERNGTMTSTFPCMQPKRYGEQNLDPGSGNKLKTEPESKPSIGQIRTKSVTRIEIKNSIDIKIEITNEIQPDSKAFPFRADRADPQESQIIKFMSVTGRQKHVSMRFQPLKMQFAEGIEHLWKKGRPLELSLIGRNATAVAVTSRFYSVIMWYLINRAESFRTAAMLGRAWFYHIHVYKKRQSSWWAGQFRWCGVMHPELLGFRTATVLYLRSVRDLERRRRDKVLPLCIGRGHLGSSGKIHLHPWSGGGRRPPDSSKNGREANSGANVGAGAPVCGCGCRRAQTAASVAIRRLSNFVLSNRRDDKTRRSHAPHHPHERRPALAGAAAAAEAAALRTSASLAACAWAPSLLRTGRRRRGKKYPYRHIGKVSRFQFKTKIDVKLLSVWAGRAAARAVTGRARGVHSSSALSQILNAFCSR
ncbi:hypothetical protein EVAR_59603_1 [Eumeta japonica]|uniref:Uncharacterized protein n=1 Tax=Eumeta variegata TaxID=151549 RepID=A0A4C1Z679_EUMVA|nr:hypothetical protein EVAR_59603_1 [Eumeta japonica]